MISKQLYPLILLIIMSLLQSCANDNKKTAQRSSPETATAPMPPPHQESAPGQPQEKKESPVGKSVEELRTNKSQRIGTVPTGKDAELNRTVAVPPVKAPAKSAPKPGPPGYITQKDMILQAEPASNAARINTLKQYEIIYILETLMTDEQGRKSPYPTWYKVERENKEIGWVVAKGVNAGAGG